MGDVAVFAMRGPFRLSPSSFGGVPTLRLSSRLVFEQNLRQTHDIVSGLLGDGHKRLIVDVAAVEAMDSSGISALLDVQQMVSAVAGRLFLLRPPERVRKALAVSRVTSLFDIVDDEVDLDRRVNERSNDTD
jgi:anti-sigma B factor antagonist